MLELAQTMGSRNSDASQHLKQIVKFVGVRDVVIVVVDSLKT
jgi:FMN-dependent NADH-azoreductase